MDINATTPVKSNDKLFIALTYDYALINNIRKTFIKIPYNGINQVMLFFVFCLYSRNGLGTLIAIVDQRYTGIRICCYFDFDLSI